MNVATRVSNRALCALTLTMLTVVAGGCDKSATAPNEELPAASDPPAVVDVPVASHGGFDNDLYKVTCLASPGPQIAISDTCPVVRWDGYDYWAMSYGDNRSSFAIHAFDASGELHGVVEESGARYVYAVDVDEEAETVTFRGQGDRTVTMTWEELRALR